MNGPDSLEPIRDFTAWPVQPVTPVPNTRRLRDMEPYSPEQGLADWVPDQDQVLLGPGARHPTIGELMTRDVVAIESHRTLAELESLLARHKVSGVPVVEAGSGNLLGVVSQSDIIRHLENSDRSDSPGQEFHQTLWLGQTSTELADSHETQVWEIMTPFIYFATEDSTLPQVIDMMLRNHIHRVVVTRERRLVGVVTSMDLLRHFRQNL